MSSDAQIAMALVSSPPHWGIQLNTYRVMTWNVTMSTMIARMTLLIFQIASSA